MLVIRWSEKRLKLSISGTGSVLEEVQDLGYDNVLFPFLVFGSGLAAAAALALLEKMLRRSTHGLQKKQYNVKAY